MKGKPSVQAIVGIIMGSDSDWPIMKAAADACSEFGIAHEVRVISAHRTPQDLARYASTFGVKAMLPKPMDPQRLFEVLSRAVSPKGKAASP